MARMPRVEFDGALYHLLCRGDRREAIFLDERDRESFLATLGEICQRNGWRVHAYILILPTLLQSDRKGDYDKNKDITPFLSQLFGQGQHQGGSGGYYYMRDHLGSIREMTNTSGTMVARFNFTGLYQHAKSALDMATYRSKYPL